jgi:subtilisin family serine protease
MGIAPASRPIRAPLANGTLIDREGGLWSAIGSLSPGDVLLIEDQVEGPDDGTGQATGSHFIADEWYPTLGDLIRAAVDAGIVVVEAAGNGGRDLDSVLYDTPGTGYPMDWRNPFRRENATGAIVVGAGDPSLGGNSKGIALGMSNHGSRIDVQAWGDCVVSCGPIGMGIADPVDWSRNYTNVYEGTSSASAIIAGIVALVQSARLLQGKAAIRAVDFQEGFAATGWMPAPAMPNKAIGPVPDAEALMEWALAKP